MVAFDLTTEEGRKSFQEFVKQEYEEGDRFYLMRASRNEAEHRQWRQTRTTYDE